MDNLQEISKAMKSNSGKLDPKSRNVAVILAAGHGKRIKSGTPKVVHPVWGVPSVLRLSKAVEEGLGSDNQVIVVGIKAAEVIRLIGKKKHNIFAYQKVQKGTGHAMQTAFESINRGAFNGSIYVFPGDAGLLDKNTINVFKRTFEKGNFDMMLLTGVYEGPSESNYYGRILRVPEKDVSGRHSGRDYGSIIEILQHKDILNLNSRQVYTAAYNGKKYSFGKKELLGIREFDSGCFAFKSKCLKKHIYALKPNNVQSEIYITDLVSVFNRAGLKIGAVKAKDSDSLLAFNNKSTWKRMESIARANYYQLLKDIVTVEDEEKFFIAEEVIKAIISMDSRFGPLDIAIGENCYIGKDVRLNKGISIGENARLEGKILLGENVKIGANVSLSAYPGQFLKIGTNTEIVGGNIIKGNTQIGENVRIETGVNITGSDEFPVRIGSGCIIKGTSYIFGSVIDPDNWIEHSILVKRRVEKISNKDGGVEKIKYFRPPPEGSDSVKPL
jgi:bifunctional UDP-N-acetylglucosamine pyrophosphorylase / glucosamine-1-phosphate N-acetyltransferase